MNFRKVIKITLLIGIALFIYSYFQKDNLPPKDEILSELYQAPLQTETQASPFKIEKEGIIYDIAPLFNYELYGLVVSYHHSESWFDYYHERWKDFINLKDICVIWGNNIETEVYKDLKFSNGSFTCYFESKRSIDGQGVLKKFRYDAGSNNHLLSGSEQINSEILKAEKGDQIYLKGYLVQYSHDNQPFRNSSATRSDTGNGACETIYLADFKILKKANSFWRSANSFSKYLIAACLVFLIIFVFSYKGRNNY